MERKEEGGLRSYVYRLIFEDGRTLTLAFKLTDKNKIAALDRPSD